MWIDMISKMLTINSNFKTILWVYKTHLADTLPVWGSVCKEGKGKERKEVLVY